MKVNSWCMEVCGKCGWSEVVLQGSSLSLGFFCNATYYSF